jgi:hypothetical protein
VKYVTIAGRKVKGVKLSQQGTWLAKFAGAGYQQVRPLQLRTQHTTLTDPVLLTCCHAAADGAIC